jgi:hypothetical protein
MTTQYPAVGWKWKERDVRIARTVEVIRYDVAKRRVGVVCLETERLTGQSWSASTGKAVVMPDIEAGLALVRMTFDDLRDAAGYVCTNRDFESANGDDEDEEEEDEEEEEEKKKEKDEEDEDDDDDDDDDDGASPRLSRQAGKIERDMPG